MSLELDPQRRLQWILGVFDLTRPKLMNLQVLVQSCTLL